MITPQQYQTDHPDVALVTHVLTVKYVFDDQTAPDVTFAESPRVLTLSRGHPDFQEIRVLLDASAEQRRPLAISFDLRARATAAAKQQQPEQSIDADSVEEPVPRFGIPG